jgi:hypothetical protein
LLALNLAAATVYITDYRNCQHGLGVSANPKQQMETTKLYLAIPAAQSACVITHILLVLFPSCRWFLGVRIYIFCSELIGLGFLQVIVSVIYSFLLMKVFGLF